VRESRKPGPKPRKHEPDFRLAMEMPSSCCDGDAQHEHESQNSQCQCKTPPYILLMLGCPKVG
jgi:hypothetical protein